MVNFRIYRNSNYFISYEEIDWDSLEPTVLLGRYMKEKSTGILYCVKRLSLFRIGNNGYNIQPFDPFYLSYSEISETVSSFNLKTALKNYSYYRHTYSESNLVTDIIFRNLGDYQKAVKELGIDQTSIVEIPFSFQIESYLPRIRERFTGLLDNSKIGACLYNPGN